MVIIVASKNPAKVEAVKMAIKPEFGEVKIQSIEVDTGVSAQPFSDEETKQGSINRAMRALEQSKDAYIAVGLEGGAIKHGENVWNTVWCSVCDRDGHIYSVNGMKFKLPDVIAQKLTSGVELGQVMDSLTGKEKTKHNEGMVGVITNGYIKRAEAYADLVKIAFGLWFGKDWQDSL